MFEAFDSGIKKPCLLGMVDVYALVGYLKL